jgi:hypothetical protein
MAGFSLSVMFLFAMRAASVPQSSVMPVSALRQLALSSYDRLFPNQDYMPKGFGNLIALLCKSALGLKTTAFL